MNLKPFYVIGAALVLAFLFWKFLPSHPETPMITGFLTALVTSFMASALKPKDDGKTVPPAKPPSVPPLPLLFMALSCAIAGMLAVCALCGCASTAQKTTEALSQEAYGKELDLCVDDAKKQAVDSQAKIAYALDCQKAVKRRWGIVEVFPRDAGGER